MSTRRKEVSLATKMQERDGEKVNAIIEGGGQKTYGYPSRVVRTVSPEMLAQG